MGERTLARNEVRGDWANLKGTEYHLIYVLWLLIKGQVSSVQFYEGNDLLAHPVLPPRLDDEERSRVVPIKACQEDTDLWIQLKSTGGDWNRSRILNELLSTFLCNALQSQLSCRQWQVRLVTQGRVRTSLQEFVSHPSVFPVLYEKLLQIVSNVKDKCDHDEAHAGKHTQTDIEKISLEILLQLSSTVPIAIETLKAEIETELALLSLDREAVRQMGDAMLGRLLQDAAAGPGAPLTYNAEWLEQVAALPITDIRAFNQDPISTCLSTSRLPRGWNKRQFVSRVRLESALKSFLTARECLFVLIGASGIGKSWAMTDCVLNSLDGRVRLLIHGSDLDHYRTLDALVAKQLRGKLLVNRGDEWFLNRLRSASCQQPPIIIIDDILPSGEAEVFRRDVTRLIEAAREYRIKLVITCQKHLWELYGFGTSLPLEELFLPEIGPRSVEQSVVAEAQDDGRQRSHSHPALVKEERLRTTSHSFLLTDLTVEEMTAAVRLRLPKERAEVVANKLRLPAYVALRNPFLLNLYLEKQSGQAGPVGGGSVSEIDDLLDGRIIDFMSHSAQAIQVGRQEIELALDSLAAELWYARPKGLSNRQGIDCLKEILGDQSRPTLNEWKRLGLLTIEEPVFLEEPLVADRLFARFLARHFLSVESTVSELRPHEDAGVIKALLRGNFFDPISLASSLLETDPRWRFAVIEGLAQCSAEDFRILALLSALARPDSRGVLEADACDALGQLAARGNRAWKWAARMYMAEDAHERYRGAHTLGAAMEYNPPRAGSAVRLRLSRARKMNNFSWDERKRRKEYLTVSVNPLTRINHRNAANIGQRLIGEYTDLAGSDSQNPDDEFLEAIDFARGRVALFSDRSFLNQLCTELDSDEPLTRYRAACAIRPIAHEEPTWVTDSLVAAIRKEQQAPVLNRLLMCLYGLIEKSPDDLIDALKTNPITLLQQGSVSSHQVLSLLGSLASRRPQSVLRILPTRLDRHEPDQRAFLSEMFSYAWWSVAQQAEETRSQLVTLAEPDLQGVADKFTPFALRGAAIAQIGKMLLDLPAASKLTEREVLFTRTGYHFLSTEGILKTSAASLLAHREYKQLEQLLRECIREEDRVQVHPIEQDLYQFQYQCANQSLEMLIHFLRLSPEPLAVLSTLPRDWQVFRAVCRLLQAGRTEQPIVDFAQSRCDITGRPLSVQAFDDRIRCLTLLADIETEPQAALELHRMRQRSPARLLWGADEPAQILAMLTDEKPERTLSLLDDTISSEGQLATLYYWYWQTRSWQSLLIARVYLRMFCSASIETQEARDLCEQMLKAVGGLPDSELRDRYQLTYETIAKWLAGDRPSPQKSSFTNSPIQLSHQFSLSLFEKAIDEISHSAAGDWLLDSYEQRDGWIETYDFEIDNGSLSHGRSTYTIYFFPAVRLSYIAVGQVYGLSDPAAQFMVERIQTNDLYKKYSYVFDPAFSADRELLSKAVKALSTRERATPNDERLWAWKGHLFLMAEQLSEAEEALLHCLSLRSCSGDIRKSAFYNLACVYARFGREEDCHQALQDAARIKPLNRDWMSKDPDFEGVQDKPWFQALIAND